MLTIKDVEELLREKRLLKTVINGGEDQEVTWTTCDSRKAVPGTLFICKGAAFKPEYLYQAIKKGSIAYISEPMPEIANELDEKITQRKTVSEFIVTDIRKAMAAVAAAFFGYERGKPRLIGITGTKGKTTTAWYLKAMLDLWEKSEEQPETGLISTILNYDGIHREDAVMTTPEALTLHEMLANMRAAKVRYATMEVSSQALKYKRVRELSYEVGVFLNISEDHISPVEHSDFEDYFSSKLSIFRQTRTACVNLDGMYSEQILRAARNARKVITFGTHPDADIRYSDISVSGSRIRFRVTCDRFCETFELAMKGSFNVENAAAAIAAAYVLRVPLTFMKQALMQTCVPGRMETFFSKDQSICGIVDFAHNRLSFEKMYDAVYFEYPEYKKVITIFGCPGRKALNRRRELGILAGLCSDHVLITSDDPGTECQEAIAQEIKKYVEWSGCPCECISERSEAVARAVEIAGQKREQEMEGMPGKNQEQEMGEMTEKDAEDCQDGEKTLILLLGRGTEKFQKIGTEAVAYPTDASLMKAALGI